MEDELLPEKIEDKENITRFVFSKLNINPKTRNLKANWLKPPKDMDEISVNRFDYTNEDFLKSIGLKLQRHKKAFFGLGIFKAKIIRNHSFCIIYTPIKKPKEKRNIYHADIRIGFKVKKNEPLPAEINYKIKEILKHINLFVDSDTNQENWVGETIKID